MPENTPPYHITDRMLALVSLISEKKGRLAEKGGMEARPQLHRSNRIRSVQSSLAIEANSLSMDEVRDVIMGKAVAGPEEEITEVRNAYRAYEAIGGFDPYSLTDLKKMHGIMTDGTVPGSGSFRTGNEGVFRGGRCIFMAPPPEYVAGLMKELFGWMQRSRGKTHPLILSCVFHYEFVFIHPFSDGNGRMARLWQTAILADWDPVFRCMPVESLIREHQEEYYRAIAVCHGNGNSDEFIVFMLEMIDRTLDRALRDIDSGSEDLTLYEKRLLDVMTYNVPYTAPELMQLLGIRSRETLRRHYTGPAIRKGLVRMGLPDKPTSRNQTYIRI